MVSFGLHWLPISCFVLIPSTFIISYAVAVALGHVEPDFPYISDTGTNPPESCIFAQLLNISAALVGATIYVRFRQVLEYNPDRTGLLKANKVTFWLGLIAALGMSIVGNFQETNVIVVHLMGAVLAFGIGNIYCWIQSFMSYKMCPEVSSRTTCHIRLLSSAVGSITFIMTFVSAAISFQKFDGDDPKKWRPENAGWTEHLISTIAEWTMAGSILIFFLTFVEEFRRLHMGEPQINVILTETIGTNSSESSSSYGTFQGRNVTREPIPT